MIVRSTLVQQPVRILRHFSFSAVCPKGHSKWQNIKDVKGVKDAEKTKKINQFLTQLKSVVNEGFDPALNTKLANLQKDYKKQSLPMDTFNNRLAKLKEEAAAPKNAK